MGGVTKITQIHVIRGKWDRREKLVREATAFVRQIVKLSTDRRTNSRWRCVVRTRDAWLTGPRPSGFTHPHVDYVDKVPSGHACGLVRSPTR